VAALHDNPTPPLGTRKRLLLVEDEPLVRRAMARVLLRHEYDVHAVEAVSDALDALGTHSFYAVVVDYELGQHRGDVVLRAAGELRPAPTRVLISARRPPAVELRDRGVFDAFLVKPFALGALLELLSRLHPRR
jgi:DNA-binding NtrC family response regulator